MPRSPLIRTIYLYVFALLGLVLVTIGSVRFVNMGLKAFVFTKADEDQKYMYAPSMMPPYPMMDRGGKVANETSTAMTAIELEEQRRWMADYKAWEEKRSKIDYADVRRQQDAAMNLALILIGLPLYLYHWRTIQKETKEAV